jgi:hypothetical protein
MTAMTLFRRVLGTDASRQKKLLKDFQTFQNASTWETTFASTAVAARYHKTTADSLFSTLLNKLGSATTINLDFGKIRSIKAEDYRTIVDALIKFLQENPSKINKLSITMPEALDKDEAVKLSDSLAQFFSNLPKGLSSVNLNLASGQTGQLTAKAITAMGSVPKSVSVTLDGAPFSQGTYSRPLLNESSPLLAQ